ncbi:efflux RND transporter periplasmic adaptor subunit [Wenyingzhuangia sp. 1_MG-2023]|nr:efflux RND transporter periplasmic adaptor subunit [Wenyingzhuangia sp. 1_MG-2023]
MKKYSIYVVLLVFGFLLGGWLMGGEQSKKETKQDHDKFVEKEHLWTCAMHPQIMKTEPGDCPICGMDLIPADMGTEGLSVDQFSLSKNAMALANIETTVVGDGIDADNNIKLSGKIVENEETNTVQVSYFSGRIERLNVNATGEKIQKGQLLATIYSPELYAAQQELITASALKKSQPELYNAVRNKLKLWKLSENQIHEIETTKKVKENFPVYATVSGTVLEKLVEEGNAVKQGQALLKIANLTTVWANFDVYEKQIHLFKKGQKINVKTNAVAHTDFEAKVDFIDPVLDLKTRTVKLRAVLKNTEGILKPGMFVEGNFESELAHDQTSFLIPATAVLWTGKRSVVYVKAKLEEPVFEMREIVLGVKKGSSYEVLHGLSIGDEVVTKGTFTVDAAAQLQGKKSMMNQKIRKTTTGYMEMTTEMDTDAEKMTNELMNLNVSETFKNQLNKVYHSYIKLKDALVVDDAKTAHKEAKTLLGKLDHINIKLLKKASVQTEWMLLMRKIKIATHSISTTENIEEQRMSFRGLSIHLTKAVEVFGINEKVFQQFCPMSDGNKGAYWLSVYEAIKNPYLGTKMPNCGEIQAVIESK